MDPVISICSDPPLINDLSKRFKRLKYAIFRICKRNASRIAPMTSTIAQEDTNSGEF
jgi:hypothetical protein